MIFSTTAKCIKAGFVEGRSGEESAGVRADRAWRLTAGLYAPGSFRKHKGQVRSMFMNSFSTSADTKEALKGTPELLTDGW